MTTAQLRALETAVLRIVRDSADPVDTTQIALLLRASTRHGMTNTATLTAVHRAVWNLVDEGLVRFSSDRRLQVAKP